NKILEFAGPGVAALPADYRIGIDVMTTETACLSSIWETDGVIEEYYAVHGRPGDYRSLRVPDGAVYDAMIEIDLSALEPMAALPFHPSEAVTVRELRENGADLLREVEKRVAEQYGGKVSLDLAGKLLQGGRLRVEQGIIAGCSGGMYDNLAEAAAILSAAGGVGNGGFNLSAYPPSIPVELELTRNGVSEKLLEAGVTLKPCFCGPCFGAGDVPPNNALSIRHTTRNFPNREGSKPGDGQLSAVLLMDARSIAATAAKGGVLTPATEIDYTPPTPVRRAYDRGPYEKRVWFGWEKAEPETPLQFGPNIVPWPEIPALPDNLLLVLASVIHDPVTTTDELIPSGETSSYRSNPIKLASFTLSRRDPEYVGLAQTVQSVEADRRKGIYSQRLGGALGLLNYDHSIWETTGTASVIFAEKPGDGSAREQAASCQRVLGGGANICREYATKRYRSNCVNWGMLPFTIAPETPFDYEPGDLIFIPGVRKAVEEGADRVSAKAIRRGGQVDDLELLLPGFTAEEREIVLAGCLMNWYKTRG
ncbi:MAG: hydratase, partial [Oscillospiraceae bacterium]|nr:hydratase [Oscillospiraceae bacterium]